jgi:hypothetical protein
MSHITQSIRLLLEFRAELAAGGLLHRFHAIRRAGGEESISEC